MSSAFTTAPPPSSSAPASMETLVAMLGRVVARFEARLEAQEQRLAMANTTPRPEPEPDPLFGRPLTSWDLPRPRISPELCSNRSDWNHSVPRAFDPPPQQPAYLESYGGRGYNDYYNNEPPAWSYNNYESQAWSYNNYESQAWPYNTYEPYRYNHFPQPVQYEPSLPAQYYSVAETQQQPYYPPPYTHGPTTVTNTTVTSPAMPPPLELHQQPQLEGSTEWQPMTPILGLSNNFQHNTPYSVPVTSNEEEEFEKWQPEVREAETRAEVEIEAGLDTKTEEELVSDVVKTEEEFMSEVEATLEVGESTPTSGSSESSLQASFYFPTDGEMHGGIFSSTIIESSISLPTLRLPRYGEQQNIGSLEQRDSEISEGKRKHRKLQRKDGVVSDKFSEWKDVILEVWRRWVIFGLYALEEVYKDLLNLHLEDKVILKGGGVDTLFI